MGQCEQCIVAKECALRLASNLIRSFFLNSKGCTQGLPSACFLHALAFDGCERLGACRSALCPRSSQTACYYHLAVQFVQLGHMASHSFQVMVIVEFMLREK